MSRTKKILMAIVAVLIIIQFIKPKKNISVVESPNDIFAHYQASDNIKQMIHTSCYDCHSNNTTYPWYAEIQPVAWWLANHINEGKSELDFSEFATYTAKKGDHKLEEFIKELKEGEMPTQSYTLMHGEAKLTAVQIAELTDWAEQLRAQIKPNIIK